MNCKVVRLAPAAERAQVQSCNWWERERCSWARQPVPVAQWPQLEWIRFQTAGGYEIALRLARRLYRRLVGRVLRVALARGLGFARRGLTRRRWRGRSWRECGGCWSRCAAAFLLSSSLGEELRPSFAVRCSRSLGGLPLLATLLHDALGVRGGRHPKQDRCGQCQSNGILHRNLPLGAGFR
jgi:hypothetical protein